MLLLLLLLLVLVLVLLAVLLLAVSLAAALLMISAGTLATVYQTARCASCCTASGAMASEAKPALVAAK